MMMMMMVVVVTMIKMTVIHTFDSKQSVVCLTLCTELSKLHSHTDKEVDDILDWCEGSLQGIRTVYNRNRSFKEARDSNAR